MADQPRRDGPDDGRGPSSPDATRRGRRSRAGADAALTVEALLARSRADGDAAGRAPAEAGPAPRSGRRRRTEDAEPAGGEAPPRPEPSRLEPARPDSARPPGRRPDVAPPAPPRPDVSRLLAPPASQAPLAPQTARPVAPGTTEMPAQQTDGPSAPPVPPAAPGVRHSAPVPRLPGANGARPSASVPPLPGADGVRHSTPVPPLPGRAPRTPAPLPPIPGRDAPAAEPPPPTRAERRAAMSPLRRGLGRVVVVLTVLVALVGGYYVGLYFAVDRSVQRVAALTPDAPEVLAPQLQEGTETYLVVGTGVPGASGPASVSPLLVHVSADRERAVLVSMPPTALVDTPECRGSDGEVRDPTTGSLADALLRGGPSCLVRAVQQLSGLRVDHYLGVDLAGLPGMVDALGGVEVCLAAPLDATVSGLALDAGTSDLSGDDVTGLLTAGTAGPDLTGVAVAEREQLVLTSTLRSALSVGHLVDPVASTTFLTRAADAFTLDEDTSLADVRALATTLGDLPADAVARTGVPVTELGYVPVGSDTAHVLLDGDAARLVFDAVIKDSRLPEPAAPAVDPAADPAAAAAAGTVAAAPAACS